MYLILFIGIALISYLVSANLKRKFKEYSGVPLGNGMTGSEVAEQMLRDNGINDVQIRSTSGHLTDFYNPADKTVYLSEGVYADCSVAAAAIAAHECGHAVQHAMAYGPLRLRSSLVPTVSAASRWTPWVLLIGILTVQAIPSIMLIGIALFAITTIFSFVTLPVEIDASRRACTWLNTAGITDSSNHSMAVSALKSAAYTYVVAALSSLATLIYYVLIYLGNSNRN